MVTLLDLKNKKASLRNKMENEMKTIGIVTDGTHDRYVRVLGWLKVAEEKILKPIGFEN